MNKNNAIIKIKESDNYPQEIADVFYKLLKEEKFSKSLSNSSFKMSTNWAKRRAQSAEKCLDFFWGKGLSKMIKGQPLFWTEKGFISNILLPLSAIYLLLSLLQQFFTTKKKISVPVICVGNIYIGGTGKTPTVQKISLFPIFKQENCRFA